MDRTIQDLGRAEGKKRLDEMDRVELYERIRQAERRADEATDHAEWLKSEWVKCWDNGYLNGREETLTQVARGSRVPAFSADHDAALLRRECGVVTSKFAGEDMISATHVRELFFDRADAIARGDSEWCPAGHGDELDIDKADRRGDA